MTDDSTSSTFMPGEKFHVRAFFDTADEAQSFLSANRLDYGCRASVRREGDALVIPALCTADQIADLESRGVRLEVGESLEALRLARLAEVGVGDRFEGGRVVPRGLGLKITPDIHTGQE